MPFKPRSAETLSLRFCKANSATTWSCAICRTIRDTKEAIESIRLLSPSGERVSLAQLCKIQVADGASQVSREGNQRYIAIKYGVRGRDLGGAVEEAIKKVDQQVKLPTGYRIDWAGEYASQQRAQKRLDLIIPLTLLVIFMILYSMFGSMKWASLILATVAMAPIGGIIALYLTKTNFSVSSGIGFLALFGVSVMTGVIMLEYINQLRARGHSIMDAVQQGAVLRFRPILMTMLVASLAWCRRPRRTASARIPAPVCYRDRRRTHGCAGDEHFPSAIALRLVCAGR